MTTRLSIAVDIKDGRQKNAHLVRKNGLERALVEGEAVLPDFWRKQLVELSEEFGRQQLECAAEAVLCYSQLQAPNFQLMIVSYKNCVGCEVHEQETILC